MSIDYRIVEGSHGGLTFNFIPCDHDFIGEYDYDRFGPNVFNIREEAFLFIEGLIAHSFPDWQGKYRHWGVTWVPRETWVDILFRFQGLRRDVKGNLPLSVVIARYVICPGLTPRQQKFHRKALLTFLDLFEARIRTAIERAPYLLIGGI